MNIVFVRPGEASELFQNVFSGIMGLKDQWSMQAHVLTKWGSVLRCLVWGSMVRFSLISLSVLAFI
jgi:hypothetical protein